MKEKKRNEKQKKMKSKRKGWGLIKGAQFILKQNNLFFFTKERKKKKNTIQNFSSKKKKQTNKPNETTCFIQNVKEKKIGKGRKKKQKGQLAKGEKGEEMKRSKQKEKILGGFIKTQDWRDYGHNRDKVGRGSQALHKNNKIRFSCGGTARRRVLSPHSSSTRTGRWSGGS